MEIFFPCPTGDPYRNHRFGDLTFLELSSGVPSGLILFRVAPLSTLDSIKRQKLTFVNRKKKQKRPEFFISGFFLSNLD